MFQCIGPDLGVCPCIRSHSLAFVFGLKRATDEGSLPDIAKYIPYYLPLESLLLSKDRTIIIHLL